MELLLLLLPLLLLPWFGPERKEGRIVGRAGGAAGFAFGGNRARKVFLADSRSSKSTQDYAWESGRLQHMIQCIPATRGTWQRSRVHMRIPEGSLMQ